MSPENTRSKTPKDPEHAAQAAARAKEMGMESRKLEGLNALIGKQVLVALGVPDRLLIVQSRPLWDGHYRVNVFVGADAACAKVAHSYFVVADGEGAILRTTPVVKRLY